MKKSQSSDYFNRLAKFLGIDKEGNITIRKNLGVDGTTKMNSGLTPILIKDGSYQTPEGIFTYQVLDFGEFENTGNRILGLISNDELELIGIGNYKISGTTKDKFDIYGVSMVNNDFEYIHLDNGEIGSEPIYERLAFSKECQPKLYRHVISLSAGSSADGSCRLEYISPKDLVCDSLGDLRTVLGNPQMQSYVASNPGGDLFGVVISPSTAQIKKVGTTSLLNITSVSDTVTPL